MRPASFRITPWRGGAILLAVVLAAGAGVVLGRATEDGSGPFRAPQWRALPAAPIEARSGATSAWTGSELLVWGGIADTPSSSGPCDRCPADGAAYDPRTRAWRPVAAAPAAVRGSAAAAWTGGELVVWASNSPDGPVGAAAYDPRANRWRSLPAGPLGNREGFAAAWTGRELVVVGGHSGDAQAAPVAAALDPRTGRWRRIAALDRFTFFGGPNGAVAQGGHVFVSGLLSLCPERGSACDRTRPAVVDYDPAGDTASAVRLPRLSSDFGADTAGSLRPVGATRTQVVFAATAPGSVRAVLYAPATRSWTVGPDAPCTLPAGRPAQWAWAGGRLVAPCGGDGIQVYDLRTRAWRWRDLVTGPSPLGSRESSAIAWTGSELIVWGGGGGDAGPEGAALALRDVH